MTIVSKIAAGAIAATLVFSGLLYGSAAFGQENGDCIPPEKAEQILKIARMEQLFSGLDARGILVQLWVNPDGRYVLTGRMADGPVCLLSHGGDSSVFVTGTDA